MSNQVNSPLDIVTVTLNPAIDQTVTIPGFKAGEVNRVEAATSVVGGKGVNVASVLADAGFQVAATGLLGEENAGPFEALFARKGIRDYFTRIPGCTRTGIKIVDPVNNKTTDINYPGLLPQPGALERFQKTLDSVTAQWVVLAGSLPPGVEPGLYKELALSLKAHGVKVAVDTSGEALHAAVQAAPHLIKPNISELEELVGHPLASLENVVEAAGLLVHLGVETVVVSMGAEGACFVTANQALVARPPAVTVRSTVGAGDAMISGMIAANLRGLPLEEAAGLATAFSLEALCRLESGLSSPEAVEAWREQVLVEGVQVEVG